MRAAWLTAGAVVTIIALTVSTVLLARGFARARPPVDTTHRSIPFAEDDVTIEAGKGPVSVRVTAGRAGELLVTRRLEWLSGERPGISEEWEAGTGTLRLDATCSGVEDPIVASCRADYMVSVPPETDVEASTTGGRLDVSVVFGDVRLSSVSGSIEMQGVSGAVWARTGTGDIMADRLDGETADVEVGSGYVHMSFVNPPTTVRAVVRTAGGVTLNLPSSRYDVSVEAAESTLSVLNDSRSPRKVTAKAPDGFVSLCCE
ncbi:hypothetical protein ITP53_33360 [Nonomuraea sp. K274]|uniref:DUF4097 domain-containing protein n=1 Tax=Nonomuraea cypriaca TaxID=1187855 RepID=A0A931F1I3_9ACTN|nr:DUF4097 family beta strand repeat-containing protein [Nonomuraea cypriaca]MBF8190520.1 hypothetical protein [Nonomuraea cypriaca]